MLSSDHFLLETAFDVLNRIYFNGHLPQAIITIQSCPKSYGYITVHKVWRDSKDSYYEINISAEHLTRNIENVLATLLHECVHLYCMVNEIQDVSNGGRYHNKKFKAQAEKCDLIIEYAKYIGYSKTTPSEQLIKVIKENGLFEKITHYRTTGIRGVVPPIGGSDGDNGKKKTSTRKYTCTECGINVRATKNVNIICADCMALMVKVD